MVDPACADNAVVAVTWVAGSTFPGADLIDPVMSPGRAFFPTPNLAPLRLSSGKSMHVSRPETQFPLAIRHYRCEFSPAMPYSHAAEACGSCYVGVDPSGSYSDERRPLKACYAMVRQPPSRLPLQPAFAPMRAHSTIYFVKKITKCFVDVSRCRNRLTSSAFPKFRVLPVTASR